jgi:hypothetical protein
MIKIIIICLTIMVSCSMKPSRRYGIDEKYASDSIEVVLYQYSNKVYFIEKEALPELDSLIKPFYEGTEGGKHYFINWSKISTTPFRINHFAIDTNLCMVKMPLSRSNEYSRNISVSTNKFRRTVFENGKCYVSEPNETQTTETYK